ncbi:MAG: tRNA (cytidine(34)-2'-O)-methyltransferase [Parvularcula sp.]
MTDLRLALYQPEIAANVGASIRNARCFDAELSVIEPCGFPWKEREISRVALDYGADAPPVRHLNWSAFSSAVSGRRILLTTKASTSLYDVCLSAGDIFVLGQESAGVPQDIHTSVDLRVTIPISPYARSLNVAMAGALALAEARRQIGYEKSLRDDPSPQASDKV